MFFNRKITDNILKMSHSKSKSFKRSFHAVALEELDLLTLQVEHIEKLREEFPEIYEELYNESVHLLQVHHRMKRRTIRRCIKEGNNQPGFHLLLGDIVNSSQESDCEISKGNSPDKTRINDASEINDTFNNLTFAR
jgi:CRP-like cAMP-binding protein